VTADKMTVNKMTIQNGCI